MKRLITNKKAFTLVEVLVVIVILGILFVILVANVDFTTDKARATGVQNNFQEFALACELTAHEKLGFNSFGWDTGDTNGNKAKDYYIVVEGNRADGFNIVKTKSIFFKRTREVFDRILERNERVSLILNDVKVGELNSYPTRVKSEFIVGQNITFNNVEYEIEHISDDCKSIFLKRENVTFKNILDTITLRRFKINLENTKLLPGTLYFTKTNLRKIKVEYET